MPAFESVRFGKYLLLDKLAMGGMAEVFRAKLIGEKGFEKPVVLKRMLPHLLDQEEMVGSFIDEARLASFLKHKNIIDIYDFGEESGTFFIAMEYLFGKDLQQVIKRSDETDHPLDIEIALYIVLRVCEGLAYAHKLKNFEGNQLNIIHRDVSPHNIFVTYEGQVKLLDFGIAKAASKSSKTQTGIIKGKAAYMSPEQAEGDIIDHRSDIFALGIILYELVTHKKMFEGDTFRVLSKVVQAEYEPPENIIDSLPDKLYDIIHKSLKKSPEDRYQSCEEMGGDLESCMIACNYHPGSKKLSGYMQALFEGQFDAEERQMAEAMTREVDSGSQTNGHTPAIQQDAARGGIEALSSDAPYQQTIAIQKEPSAVISALKNGLHTLSIKAKSGQEKIRAFDVRNKKNQVVIGIVSLVILLGAGVGYMLRPLDVNELKIRNLLEQADDGLDEDRIILPNRNSAYFYYKEVLKIDPENRAAEKGLDKILDKCIQAAEQEIEKSNLSLARKYVFTGLKIDPQNERLLELKSQVALTPRRLLDKFRNTIQN